MLLASAVGVLFLSTGCGLNLGTSGLKKAGVEYQLQELTNPRTNRVHILRVDFSKGKTEAAVIIADDPDGAGPAEAALTNPLKLAENRAILAFVNTNPWDSFPDSAGKKNRHWYESQPVDISGLAASGGQVRSTADGYVALWVDASGRVFLGTAPTDGSVMEGMSGFSQIVKEGALVDPPGGAIHPRTAMGVDRSGRVMWLVVVDGRQKGYSEGMTLQELGSVMHGLGCWNAANMDGGGSSIMGLTEFDEHLRIVNSPSNRHQGLPKIRPLPMVLTIRKKSN